MKTGHDMIKSAFKSIIDLNYFNISEIQLSNIVAELCNAEKVKVKFVLYFG